MKKQYQVVEELSQSQVEAITSRLIYSLEGISHCCFYPETKQIEIDIVDKSKEKHIDQVIQTMIEEQKSIRPFPKRIIRKTDGDITKVQADEEKIVAEFSELIRKESAVILYDALQRLFTKYAISKQARARIYSSLILRQTLEKCQYVKNFPQNLYVVAEFPHEYEVLNNVSQTDNYEEYIRCSEYLLSPALCFHCYEEYSNQTLHEPLLLSTEGVCFRHEAPWRLGKHRLHNFRMREFVFMGDESFVEETRSFFLDLIWILFVNLGFRGYIETAHDPFYFPHHAGKSQYQLMAHMKYELIISTDIGNFSIASFNNVKDTLCKEFSITGSNGSILHSGCVAFGIDRWVYALLAVYGTQLQEWPTYIKEILDI
ncbi:MULTISPECIES: aminoacyl--tRNA ligase-related protein [Aneurinibacillus]|uniref:Amino acid--ACP ligase n=1 Tax=Aneurinibacillus thermoaerophilus TaxID=143495 RepID=A0A1G7YDB3_ANETH|nr:MULTISPECIES: aminoacyl--tRNA ligase-related protein [Aneurinibacillus]AMA72209.1 amino acid--ACP ligase [Aneurinibacillus sp. XH2]MED0679008.1 amino acid--ACP ligase [Aneurinibacillus thermoaerophilus]MED0736545.1 amino acid--ACP ligase [Aneurinibacillus thermoaerophilus]MED0756049.1 amino acid--ACP ligase [Aneurinibacillus thermoaerophilus]MED0759627.1 amino acid--ACP ligase [Aneurinibacillus thermoaerophilus]